MSDQQGAAIHVLTGPVPVTLTPYNSVRLNNLIREIISGVRTQNPNYIWAAVCDLDGIKRIMYLSVVTVIQKNGLSGAIAILQEVTRKLSYILVEFRTIRKRIEWSTTLYAIEGWNATMPVAILLDAMRDAGGNVGTTS